MRGLYSKAIIAEEERKTMNKKIIHQFKALN
jgi:hypothetical protein